MKTIVVLLLLVSAVSSWARFIEAWDYEKLAENADVILVAAPIEVEETKELEAVPKMFIRGLGDSKPVMARVTLTTFSVQTALKGVPHVKQFVLRHLRAPEDLYSERQSMIAFQVNGPSFVSFDSKSNDCYLMFLKRLPNGQYVSVTGPFQSVREYQEKGFLSLDVCIVLGDHPRTCGMERKGERSESWSGIPQVRGRRLRDDSHDAFRWSS